MSFVNEIRKYSWDGIGTAINEKTASDVERALQAERCGFDDLLALLSPAAVPMLEDLARASHHLTVQRFGRVIQLYAPLYVSNMCVNSCVYCGFNRHNQVRRATLSVGEVLAEGEVLHRQGFRHVLLLTGESPRQVSPDDLGRIAEELRRMFASISIEVYPMDTVSYSRLIDKGVDGLSIYQETYHRECYATIHPAGPKRDYDYRVATPDRGGEAGFRRLNIGVLLGLSDWRVDGAFLGMHAAYLARRYWRSHIAISFPRLRPAAGGYVPAHPVSDMAMVQLICALRMFLPDAGLVLSTREPPQLRDNLIPLGITHMSAGSKTAPGGYASHKEAEGQFEVNDNRSSSEVARTIEAMGYEPVWKDWDTAFLHA